MLNVGNLLPGESTSSFNLWKFIFHVECYLIKTKEYIDGWSLCFIKTKKCTPGIKIISNDKGTKII